MSDNIYMAGESKALEFKSSINKFKPIHKTCIAFANGVGGKIVFGIEDKTRQIIGISDKLRDKIYDDFHNSLYDSTPPNLMAQIYRYN